MMQTQAIKGASLSVDVKIRNALPDDLEALAVLLQALFSIESDFKADTARQLRGLSLLLDGCGKHRCVKVCSSYLVVLPRHAFGVAGLCAGEIYQLSTLKAV
jgi:hypothetical protein